MNFQAFFETYYREIIAGAIAVAYVITSILIARKGYKADKLAYILQCLPEIIAVANSILGSKTGKAKLVYVLSMCRDMCSAYKIDFDRAMFTEEIEKILSADKPQKEVVSDETQESKSQQGSKSFLFYRQQDQGD